MRPNIFLGTCDGSTQYKKWYFEVMVDEVEPFLTAQAFHLHVGWALTEGYSPYPGGGEGWGGNGVGDDLYSYGFDGLHLWSGRLSLESLAGRFTASTGTFSQRQRNLSRPGIEPTTF